MLARTGLSQAQRGCSWLLVLACPGAWAALGCVLSWSGSTFCSAFRAPLGPEEAQKLAEERARAPIVPFGVDLCHWGQEQPVTGKILRRVQSGRGSQHT